ncbi:hypothetical protein FJW07_17405 [Mesorhizobium sp. B3-1-9]|nr:hypothetical protein FJW07_17405 [Mesorhizobium sp. B3-1-9]
MHSCTWSSSAFDRIAELLQLIVFTQFRTENRCALFLEIALAPAGGRPGRHRNIGRSIHGGGWRRLPQVFNQ